MESCKNLTIGILSVTATILFVGLILVNALAPSAHAAAGPGSLSGNYVLANGQFKVEEELFYLIDSSSEQMVVYRFDSKTRQTFGPTQSIDLAAMRQGSSPPPQTPSRSRGGYNRP